MLDGKSIVLVAAVGAVSGMVGALLVLYLLPDDDTALRTSLERVDERVGVLEARRQSQNASATPRESDSAEPSPSDVQAPRPASNDAPPVFRSRDDVRRLMDESLDPEERLARARSLLDSPMQPARYMAIRTLIDLGDPGALGAVQAFVDQSGGDPRALRMAAGMVDLLGGVEGSAIDIQLYEYLSHDDDQLQVAAARQLEARGDGNPIAQIVDGIAQGLIDDDRSVRIRAAQALGRTRSASAVGPLTEALRDESSEVRLRAVQGLGWTGDDSAISALTGALEDPIAEVRSAAARSLDLIRNPQRRDGTATRFFGGP